MTHKEILSRFKGSEIHNYLEKLNKEEFKSAFKVQFVDKIPKLIKGKVGKILDLKNQRPEIFEEMVKIMELDHLLERHVGKLSGGELQRFTILITIL